MVRRRGPRLTLAEKTELWRRWRRGESLNAIGRALGRIAKVVRYEVARTGGIAPPTRQRSRLALTLAEREAISRGLARGPSLRQISRQLRRPPSTVSREVRRHGGRRRYRAAAADAAAWARGRRPKRCRLATHPALRDAVATKLAHACPLHPGAVGCDCARAQHATPQDTRLPDAGRYARGNRCIDRLNSHPSCVRTVASA